jgi:hypothetical protein
MQYEKVAKSYKTFSSNSSGWIEGNREVCTVVYKSNMKPSE